ncbi:MAG TPA: response regulator transcription factor [Rhodocyclaceae bacterium]|nr:response regulator transcription factor [Rhodocyclaceae bacterium]
MDDHPIVREGVANFLNIQSSFYCSTEAATMDEALTAMSLFHHDLAIVDLSLDGGSGLELIRALRRSYPELPILTLSMHDEAMFAERAFCAGANGYLMKQEGTQMILSAVKELLAGNIYMSSAMQNKLSQRLASSQGGEITPLASLSAREFEILHLIGLGLGTREISERLHRSIKTIEAHRANLREKLKLDSGRDLVRFAIHLVESGEIRAE